MQVSSFPVISNLLLSNNPIQNLPRQCQTFALELDDSNIQNIENESNSNANFSNVFEISPPQDPINSPTQNSNTDLPIIFPTSQIENFSQQSLCDHNQISSELPTQSNPENLELSSQPVTSSIMTRSKTGNNKPKKFPKYKLYYSTRHPLYVFSSVLNEQEPTCFTQAMSHPEWRAAMGQEFDALMENGTWSLCPRPHNMHVVRNK